MINYHFKGLCKTTYYKTKPSYSQFFFPHWLMYESFFCFFYQSVCKYHRQAFIGYKNGENLKILIKVFCHKLIVSGVILAFLDHVKAKIFFVIQPWWLIYSTPPPSFENLWIRLCMIACYSIFLSLITSLISVCFVVIKSFFFMKKLLKSRNDWLLIYHLLLYFPMFCKTFIL